MRFDLALGLTIASALSYGLAFPTTSLQLLAWVCLVPFLVALQASTARRALVLGWVWTLGAAYAVGSWFPQSVARYYEQPLAVGIGFFLFVSTFMAAPFYMAFAAAYRVLARRAGVALPFAAAAAWVACELARARLVGNPWALFGYSQVGRDALVQIADVTSVYGISFMLVAVNAAVAQLVLHLGRRRSDTAVGGAATGGGARVVSVVGCRSLFTSVAVAAALPLLAIAYGKARMATTPLAAADAPPVRVAMIQANLDVGTQWREEFYGENLGAYLALTSAALRDGRPELVFWPENALTFFLEQEPLYRAAIARVLAPAGAELVTGGPRVETDTPAGETGGPRAQAGAGDPVYYNSVFLLDGTGAVLSHYDKQRLVPFGEYFPLRALDFLRRRFARVRELTAGRARLPLPTSAGPAGVMICNEAMFPDIAAARARAGAVFFVDPAHDTWLTPRFSAQQFDIVRLRTVEERRYLVRASTSGPSAIVDPLGRVVDRTDFLVRGTLGGTIWPLRGATPYRRIGDAFAYGCALAAIVAVVGRLR